jgi:alkanesulfonate monooxygenase SsuD/methylene tetrahydromethanopterin reductase-like flavin-dependent oxidoreductase (luciferase family)
LMLEPQEGLSVSDILEWGSYAERSGYGYIFRSDHLLPISGRPRLASTECWVTLGALAARTNKIRFGPMVSPIGFRNPAILARMACTVYSLSSGRLQFGVGAGWFQKEYAAHGLPFPEVDVRFEQLREALQIMFPLIRGERVDFDGKHFSAHTDCLPRPKGRVNLIIGGKGLKLVRIAAEFADEWNVFGPTREAFLKAKKELERRTTRKIQVSQTGPFLIARNRRELETEVMSWVRRRGTKLRLDAAISELKARGTLVGTPEDFVAQLNENIDWGIERFYFQVLDTNDRKSVKLLTETLKSRT